MVPTAIVRRRRSAVAAIRLTSPVRGLPAAVMLRRPAVRRRWRSRRIVPLGRSTTTIRSTLRRSAAVAIPAVRVSPASIPAIVATSTTVPIRRRTIVTSRRRWPIAVIAVAIAVVVPSRSRHTRPAHVSTLLMEALAMRRLEATAATDDVPIGAGENSILLLETLEQDATMRDALRGKLVACRDRSVIVDVRQTGVRQWGAESSSRHAIGVGGD